MRFRLSWRVLVLGFALLGATSSASPAGDQFYLDRLDPSTGVINGRLAVAIYPVRFENQRAVPLPAGEFRAHLTSAQDPTMDFVFPAGRWFQPSRGRYRVWMEGDWLVSPYTLGLSYGGGPFRGQGLSGIAPVVDAGKVILPAEFEAMGGATLRLLHAGPYLEQGIPRRELVRHTPAAEVGAGVQMPVGPAIAGLWSEREQRYIALSRPFQVTRRQRVVAPLVRPRGTAHLVVQLRRHSKADTVAELPVEMALVQNGTRTPPDHVVATAMMHYGFWYDLKPGVATVLATSPSSGVELRGIDLRAGHIERQLARLEPLIDFGVAVEGKSRTTNTKGDR